MWGLISQVGAWCSMASLLAMGIIEIRRRRGNLHRQKQLIEAAPAKDRARLLEATLGRFAIDTGKLTPAQQSKMALEMLRQRSERFRWGLIATAGLLVLSLGALMAASSMRPKLYQIRVTILGLDGQPTDSAELSSSVDGVQKQLSGGWELEVPVAKRPASGRVALWATQGPLSSPRIEIELGRETILAQELQLERVEVDLRGIVVNEAGEAIPEARVFVVGFEHDFAVTGPGGNFVINAHAAQGERVPLRVVKSGYRTREQSHLAGRAPVTLVLEEQ